MRLPLSGYPILIRFLILGTIALFFGRGVGYVSAEIIHHLKFTQGPIVMVWHDGRLIQSGQVIELHAPQPAPEAQPLAGTLLAASGVFPETGSATSITFKVASNAAFEIWARSHDPVQGGGGALKLSMGTVGPNARHIQADRNILATLPASALSRPVRVFVLPQRTALRPGAPETQAIEMTLDWSETDLNDISVEIRTP